MGESFRLYGDAVRVERARYFLAAVAAGSLRAAATRSGISQPALGQQIALLEEELDVVLLTRTRLGVRPTPAGQALLHPLSRLVAAEDAVHGAAIEAGAAYHGRVHVGGVSVTVETIVAPVVGHLREYHPGLRFAVHEGASNDIEADVLAGELDLGVITTPERPPASGLERVPLLAAPVGVHLRTDHPLAGRDHLHWHDLETWPIVTMAAGTVLWEQLQRHLPDPDVVVSAMSARTLKVMVARGAGAGVLARFDTSADVADLVWVPLRDAEPVRVCLVQRRDHRPSRSALIVRRLIRERAAALAGSQRRVERGAR